MNVGSRKFYVWLITLAAVLLIYLLYNRLSKTPQIEIGTMAEFTTTVADSNVSRFGDKIGKIGDVGVKTVQKARYVTLNEQKQIDREFGFGKLLHEAGNEWEIEEPFMNIFRGNFKCYLTADKGRVQVETAAGKPRPKDAILTGNVVIHILPEESSDIKESFIYLDDVVFDSERSQFSTDGPVNFVSEDVQMLGTGLELVYNDELNRLEYLRIIHLESLHLRTSSKRSLFQSEQTDVSAPAATAGQVKTEPPAEPVAAVVPQNAEPSPMATGQTVKQKKGQNYRALFSKNVVIDCPQQLIFADEVFINNIFFSESSDEKSGKADTISDDKLKTHDATAAEQSKLDSSSEELVDIVVTCDNGIFVTPMDSPRRLKSFAKPGTEAAVTADKGPKILDANDGRATFAARRIDYDYGASAGDIVAAGPLELVFYPGGLTGAETKAGAVPVRVTTQKKAEFLPALNRVIFEGSCVCTMLREDPNVQRKYTLSAPKLTIDLSSDKAKQSSEFASGIKHLTADGGVVQLATAKTAGEKLLGFTKLKCLKFDYDSSRRMFLATGPGIIALDNSQISESQEKSGRFSFRRRCYAIMENFDTLEYFFDENRIIADSKSEAIFINYFPIVNGEYGEQVSVNSSRFVADLIETAAGRSELSTLTASGKITYEDRDKQFVGSKLFYDAGKALVTVYGDQFQPCLLNGALVDVIEYDLKRDKVKTEIVGPGTFRTKRRVRRRKSFRR